MHHLSGVYRHFVVINKILIMTLIFLVSSCSPKSLSVFIGNQTGQTPLYIIIASGPESFYFETKSDGPVLIASLAEASINPFIPWSHSCHISHFLPIRIDGEEILYAAVNRGGILELRNSGKENAIYFYTGREIAENCTMEAFFSYNQKPTILFTNERFFSVNEHVSPDDPLWALYSGFLKPITISAINTDKPEDSETNAVFLGRDNNWYIQKKRSGQEISYFRTVELSLSGQEIYVQQYQEAFSPLETHSLQTPAPLEWAMDKASKLAGKPCIASVVSPDFPAKRLFYELSENRGTVSEASEEFPVELSGYYRPATGKKDALVLLIFPDGRGVYCRSNSTGKKGGYFTLPALPSSTRETALHIDNTAESFTYTGVALLGDDPGIFLIASWEEQKNWNVGAAGFLLLEINW